MSSDPLDSRPRTPVLAIAEAAQTPGAPWDAAVALSAVTAIENGGGLNPLDALDDWADSPVNAGEAGKLIVLVIEPLGLDPERLRPVGRQRRPRWISPSYWILTAARATRRPTASSARPSSARWPSSCCAARPTRPRSPRSATANAPMADGTSSADADDDPFPADSDVDTTALAVQALVAGGATWTDPAIPAALKFIASKIAPSGGFVGFVDPDPNATASAMVAITAAGFDPAVSCWRDSADPTTAGTAYIDPSAWLRSQQQPDGRIASPNDAFPPINTFATSQSVQALLLSWWPMARATGSPTCVAPVGPPVTPIPVQPFVHGMKRFVSALACALVLVGSLAVATAPPVVAATSRAVVVIDTGSGSRRAVISFNGTITGIQALQLAGASPATYGYSGQGVRSVRARRRWSRGRRLVPRHPVRPPLLGLLPRDGRCRELDLRRRRRGLDDRERRRRRGLALRHRPATSVCFVLRCRRMRAAADIAARATPGRIGGRREHGRELGWEHRARVRHRVDRRRPPYPARRRPTRPRPERCRIRS